MTFKSALPLVVVVSSLLVLSGCPVYAEEFGSRGEMKKVETIDKKEATNAGKRLAQAEVMKERVATKSATTKPRIASGSANTRDKVASRAAELKAKLMAFRDQKKAAIIERISTNLNNVNQRRTSAMLQQIDALMGILTKADERATAAQSTGANVADAITELGLSKTALANAKIAVEEQSKKNYDIQIATESSAKADVKETRDLLEQDLKATHSLVKEARRILINSLIKLGQTLGGATTNESK